MGCIEKLCQKPLEEFMPIPLTRNLSHGTSAFLAGFLFAEDFVIMKHPIIMNTIPIDEAENLNSEILSKSSANKKPAKKALVPWDKFLVSGIGMNSSNGF
jgi:hypothetical protein